MRMPPPRRRRAAEVRDGYAAADQNYRAQGQSNDTLPRSDRADVEPTRSTSRSPLANLQAFLNRRMKKQKR